MPDITYYTLAQICDAVESTLSGAAGMAETESYDELGQALASDDLPTLQVYPQSCVADPLVWGERTTFRGGVRVTQFVIHADLYAAERGELGEDMKTTTDMIDALIDVFQAAGRAAPPFFGAGSEAIKAFTWSFRRSTFRYSGKLYAGARFPVIIRVF